MIEAIWGRHGAIFPRTRKAVKLILTGIAAVLSVIAPFIVWVLMGVYHW